METLQQIWKRLADAGYETDKFSVHSYGEVYEEILAPYRHTAKNVLEIGLFNGHSLRMWKEYFTNATIHGIDCDILPHGGMADLRPIMSEGVFNIKIGDATKKDDIDELFGDTKFEIIIDDSNHVPESQLEAFLIFKDRLTENGIYLIEDLQDVSKCHQLFGTIDDSRFVAEIIDRRNVKGRYDDVLLIIKTKD